MITLQYPVLASSPGPPEGSGWHDSGLPGLPLKREWAYHIDKIRAAALLPDMTQQRTCGIKLDEAEELLIEAAREEMSQLMHFGEMLGGGAEGNVTNEAAENRFRKHNSCI